MGVRRPLGCCLSAPPLAALRPRGRRRLRELLPRQIPRPLVLPQHVGNSPIAVTQLLDMAPTSHIAIARSRRHTIIRYDDAVEQHQMLEQTGKIVAT